MGNTVLLYFITSSHGEWLVHSESQCYGPFGSHEDAFACAHAEADAASALGFMSMVLSRPGSDGAFEVRWRYGCENDDSSVRLD